MLNGLKKILSIIIFLLVLGLLGYYIKVNWHEFHEIKIVSWWSLAGLAIFTVLTFLIQGRFLKIAVQPYKINLKFNEWFGLVALTMLGNFIFPFSGWGFRAIYLKKKYALSYSQFVATTVANWLTNFLIFTLGGLLGLGVIYYLSHQIEVKLLVVLIIVLVFSSIAFLPVNKIKSQNKLIEKILNPFRIWQEYITHKKTLWWLFVITFWQFLATIFLFYFAYHLFGFRVSIWESFLPATLSIYALFIRIVPANLGLYELAVVYPSQIFGLTITEGLSISFATRIVAMFWTFALGAIFGYILLRRKK